MAVTILPRITHSATIRECEHLVAETTRKAGLVLRWLGGIAWTSKVGWFRIGTKFAAIEAVSGALPRVIPVDWLVTKWAVHWGMIRHRLLNADGSLKFAQSWSSGFVSRRDTLTGPLSRSHPFRAPMSIETGLND
jgi:hypothetical protein